MSTTKERDALTLGAEVDDGYMVVHVGYGVRQPAHPSGYFSVTADTYSSRGAFELGATNAIHSAGCQHDAITAAFPQLAPIVALHMSDVETGEPPHAESNGWYNYAGSRADLRATERYTRFSSAAPRPC